MKKIIIPCNGNNSIRLFEDYTLLCVRDKRFRKIRLACRNDPLLSNHGGKFMKQVGDAHYIS